MSGPDNEPSVCDVCGTDEHTAAELEACIASAIAPRPLPLCQVCGSPEPCDDLDCARERAWQREAWAEHERDTLHLWRNR